MSQVRKQRLREVKGPAWVPKPAGGRMKIRLGPNEVQLPYGEEAIIVPAPDQVRTRAYVPTMNQGWGRLW